MLSDSLLRASTTAHVPGAMLFVGNVIVTGVWAALWLIVFVPEQRRMRL